MNNTKTQSLAASGDELPLAALWSHGAMQELQSRPEHLDSSETQWQRIEDAFNFHGHAVSRIWQAVLSMADSIAQRASEACLCEVVLPRNYRVLLVGQTPFLFKCEQDNTPRFVVTSCKSIHGLGPAGLSPINGTEMCEVVRDLEDGWLKDLAHFLEQRCTMVQLLDSLLASETSFANHSDSLRHSDLSAGSAEVAATPVLTVDLESQLAKRRKALSELGRGVRDSQEACEARKKQTARRMTLRDLGRGARDSLDGGAKIEETVRQVAAA